MGAEGNWGIVSPPTVAPLISQREEHWGHFEDSVNAVSFGFVATAILITMFLVMAIFERFLWPRATQSGGRNPIDLEAQMVFGGKIGYPSPKVTVYGRGVSVLMPGEEFPTFIAQPAPAPCPPEPISRPLHHYPCVAPN
ncbi:CTTNBP 2 amino-terminal-like protein [Quillaja saponaria]|uniref:CTTNBP 2 amino-terminal-like protein n=1 Tax=Quillaja saponaria TaxID=32244 RepID=A0AAD7QH34_QUISA|nr:CTTNBP 2 amino-terminal-like protein [Quillaja saponaria]